MKNKRILVVDDDRAVCTSLKLLLSKNGFEVDVVFLPSQIEEKLEEKSFDLVILDMNFRIETTGQKGLMALKLIKRLKPDIPVILMTGWATVALAVEGMKLGAGDFVAKPWDNKKLLESVRSLISLSEPNIDTTSFDLAHIIGESGAIKEILAKVKKVGRTSVGVLIQGESGTGKELIAEAIHHCSPRLLEPFVKVNLGGLPKTLFESELFGYKKGAFTGAHNDRIGRFGMADKGTIFLDEIGELDLESQVKMLRVLQESTFEQLGSSLTTKVDIRVVAATNRDLEEMVKSRTFREDLYYRLNIVILTLPPLRKRSEDIPLLIDHFMNIFCTNHNRPQLIINVDAVSWLSKQSFKGNIRQLKNLIEKCVILAEGNHISLNDVQGYYKDIEDGKTYSLPEVGAISLDEMEKAMIVKALQKYDNKVSDAAKSLGLTRSSLYRRIEKHEINL